MKKLTSRALFTIGTVSLAASLLVVSVGNAEWSLWNPFGGGAVSSSSSSSQDQTLPTPSPAALPLAASEGQVVAAVEKAEPAVVSVIITEELPVIEREMQTGGTCAA